MLALDLTPFGYTPTETLAYRALLDLGPSSGYAVAKHLSIARANAYQALNGLVAKGSAAVVGHRPQRFRAVQPAALLARIADTEARKLDRLEDQVRARPGAGADTLVPLAGLRSVQEVATRTIARAAGEVQCVSSAEFLQALVPAFRKRDADGSPTRIWCVGPVGSLSWTVQAELPAGTFSRFGAAMLLVVAADGGLVAALEPEACGYWTSDRLLLGVIATAILQLTA